MNLEDILLSENIVFSINQNLNYLLKLIPELDLIIDYDHKNPHHNLDVWEHTLYALSLSQPFLTVRLSLLLHDIGKPIVAKEIDGIRHYKDHQKASAVLAKEILERLGYDEEYTNKICYLIRKHDLPITKEEIKNNYELEYQRFLIQKCDTLAHHPKELEERNKYIVKTYEKFRKPL